MKFRWWRRRPTVWESFHDAEASAAASRWLGALAAECELEGIPLPPIITVEIITVRNITVESIKAETAALDAAASEPSVESVRLRLAAPRHEAPAKWVVSPDATVWTRGTDGLAASSRGRVPHGLVAVGLRDLPTMLVDLSGGLVSLRGEPADRIEVAHRWVDERARASWSRGLPVTLVDLSELATETTLSNTARQVADVVERGGEGFAVFRELASGAERTRLVAAVEAPGCRWIVVVLGESEARWCFDALSDGSVTSDTFPSAPAADPVLAGAAR